MLGKEPRSDPERGVPLRPGAAPRVHDRGAPAPRPALEPLRPPGAPRLRSRRPAARTGPAQASGGDRPPPLAPGDERETQPTLGFQRVLQRSLFHVQSSGKEAGDRRERSRGPVRGARGARGLPAEPAEHYPSRRGELHLARNLEGFRRHGGRHPPVVDRRRRREGGRTGWEFAARVVCHQPQPAGRGRTHRPPSSAGATRSSARSRSSAAAARTTRCSWAMRGSGRPPSRKASPRRSSRATSRRSWRERPSIPSTSGPSSPARSTGEISRSVSRGLLAQLSRKPKSILFIDDEIHTIIGAGAASGGGHGRLQPHQADARFGRAALHRLHHLHRVPRDFRQGSGRCRGGSR